MADELQALLNKITDDEWKKTDAEREKVLSQAREEAEAITKQAKSEAQTIVKNAKTEADMFLQKGEESLRQASRDVLLALRKELEERVTQTVTEMMKSTLSGTTLAQAVVALLQEFVKKDGATDDITVLLPKEQVEAVEKAVRAQLAADFKAKPAFAPAAFPAGFKLQFKETGVLYDFTDDSLAQAVSAYVGPKIAAMLTPKA